MSISMAQSRQPTTGPLRDPANYDNNNVGMVPHYANAPLMIYNPLDLNFAVKPELDTLPFTPQTKRDSTKQHGTASVVDRRKGSISAGIAMSPY